MTSPSIANNMVVADTQLTFKAVCPKLHACKDGKCVCEAGHSSHETSRNDPLPR